MGSSELKTVTQQAKPRLLVIHGWAMNSSVWEFVKEGLLQHYNVIWVDLPGHGKVEAVDKGHLDSWVDTMKPLIEQPCHILAWSLGGLVAQRLAQRFPQQVLSLILVAISPSFIQRKDWNQAVEPKVLQGFADNLRVDYHDTIKRFVALQFLGVKNYKDKIKPWLDNLLSHPAQLVSLQQGLNILALTDGRDYELKCPVLWLLGEKDRLVPHAVSKQLLALGNHHHVQIIKGAGHAPFISYPDQFISIVNGFILNKESN